MTSEPRQGRVVDPCLLCDGWGEVIPNAGIDSPGRPEIVPCPECNPRLTLADVDYRGGGIMSRRVMGRRAS